MSVAWKERATAGVHFDPSYFSSWPGAVARALVASIPAMKVTWPGSSADVTGRADHLKPYPTK